MDLLGLLFLIIVDPYLAFYIQERTKFTWVAVKGGSKPEWNQTVIELL
jgi:hypothetical protein